MNEITVRAFWKGRFFFFTVGQLWDTYMQAIYTDLCIQGVHWERATGYKDKKGSEVFEGDIIKNCGGTSDKIVWHDGAFIIGEPDEDPDEIGDYYILLGECSVEQFEVIGNIHESPELIPTSV